MPYWPDGTWHKKEEAQPTIGTSSVTTSPSSTNTGVQDPSLSGYTENLQGMLGASKPAYQDFVSRLATQYGNEADRIAPLVTGMDPSQAMTAQSEMNLPFSQNGLQEYLQKVYGSNSREGYSDQQSRLDAYLSSAAGLGPLEDQRQQHTALLKSLGLAADPPPVVASPVDSTPPPGAGGGVEPAPQTGMTYEDFVNFLGSWTPWTPPAYVPPTYDLPQYTPPPAQDPFPSLPPYVSPTQGAGGYSNGTYTPATSPQSTEWHAGDYQTALQRFKTYGISALDAYERSLLGFFGTYENTPTQNSGGGSTDFVGTMQQTNDYVTALQRYQTWGINSLDSYERGLLGLTGDTQGAANSLVNGINTYITGPNNPSPEYQIALQRYQSYGLESLDSYERSLLGLSGGSTPTVSVPRFW